MLLLRAVQPPVDAAGDASRQAWEAASVALAVRLMRLGYAAVLVREAVSAASVLVLTAATRSDDDGIDRGSEIASSGMGLSSSGQ